MWISEVGFNLLKQLSFQFLQEDGLTHTLYQFSSPCQVYPGDQMPTALPPHSYQVCSLSAVCLSAHSRLPQSLLLAFLPRDAKHARY